MTSEPQDLVPPDPSPPDAPTPVVEERWRLVGRVTPLTSELPAAAPFPGGRELVARCGELRPCAAERWQREEDGTTRDLLLVGDHIEVDDERWPATWRWINGTLETCLGYPLFDPPAADPTARRLLAQVDGRPQWVLQLGGQGRCGLSGLLVLSADDGQLVRNELEVDGQPWSDGGRQLARRYLIEREARPLPVGP